MKSTFLLLILIAFLFCYGEMDLKSPERTVQNEEKRFNCTSYNALGIQTCVVGIDSVLLPQVGKRQNEIDSSWVTSIQSVLNYHGFEISLKQLMEQTWGSNVKVPANNLQIISALNRSYTDIHGNRFTLKVDSISASHLAAAQELANNNPVIIGTHDRAMILTSLKYERDLYGNGNVVQATVYDPSSPDSEMRILNPREWYKTSLLVRIRAY